MDSVRHLGTNQRWTRLLAERLQGRSRTSQMAVLNAGIGGNRILHDIVGPSGLSRPDRDAERRDVVPGKGITQAHQEPAGW